MKFKFSVKVSELSVKLFISQCTYFATLNIITGKSDVIARGLVRLATRVLVHGAGRRAGCLGETLCSRPEPPLAGDGVDVEQVRKVVAGRKREGGGRGAGVQSRDVRGRGGWLGTE